MSGTTSSTEPIADSSYAGPRGPAHPYGLYPQGVAAEASTAMSPSIPIGFSGVVDQYRRRIGPEGEEIADIIGPDGHTEQLPPYTRYPDEAYARKVRDVESAAAPAVRDQNAEASASSTPAAAAPAQAILGAGGLGLATRNPEFESTEDLGSPRSRHSSRTFTTASEASHHEINAAAANVSEKVPLSPGRCG